MRNVILAMVLAATGCATSGLNAATFSLEIVADNDFAVFTGTSSSINHLLYQNNERWSEQIPALSTLEFTLPSGDTVFYVLGMGGGGQENVSGLVNGVDMTTISTLMSSNLSSYLSGYSASLAAVENGTYTVSLTDVQTAFSSLTWGSPTTSTSATVIGLAAPNGVGYSFDSNSAHLFSFQVADTGVSTVPEPSSFGLAAFGLSGLLFLLSRKKRVQ